MTLDDLLYELKRLRSEHPGSTEVAITVNGRAYLRNEDETWPTILVDFDADEGVISIDNAVE